MHAIVVDSSTCQLYETWDTRQSGATWLAGSGATWNLGSDALRTAGWTSADAAGLPILPGLLRWDEVLAGNVDHAIRFTTNVTDRSVRLAGPAPGGLGAQLGVPADGRVVPAARQLPDDRAVSADDHDHQRDEEARHDPGIYLAT